VDDSIGKDLKRYGFACVKLNDDMKNAFHDFQVSLPNYFQQVRGSEPSALDDQRFFGYKNIPQIKEFSKLHMNEHGVFPPMPKDMEESTRHIFQILFELTKQSLISIAKYLKVDPNKLVDLVATNHEQYFNFTSILAVFQYFHPNLHKTPCESHYDDTLITVIPHASDIGLELYNSATNSWEPVEEKYDSSYAFVFGGEILERLTEYHFTACAHKVVSKYSTPRFSCPIQIYPREDALINPNEMSGPVLGTISSKPVITAKEFIDKSKKLYQSVNYQMVVPTFD